MLEGHDNLAALCTKVDCFSLPCSQEPNNFVLHTLEAGRPFPLTSMAARFPLFDNCRCIRSNLAARNSTQHLWGTAWGVKVHYKISIYVDVPEYVLAISWTMSACSCVLVLPFAGLSSILWRFASSLPVHCARLFVSADAGLRARAERTPRLPLAIHYLLQMALLRLTFVIL